MTLYLQDKEVAERYGVHRTAIWRWVREVNFPKPTRLTPGTTRWKLSDVEEWEKARFGVNRVDQL